VQHALNKIKNSEHAPSYDYKTLSQYLADLTGVESFVIHTYPRDMLADVLTEGNQLIYTFNGKTQISVFFRDKNYTPPYLIVVE